VDGRRPKGTADQPAPFLKFIVRGEAVPNDATVVENTPLRPHVPILPQEIVTTRRFRLGRNQGAWSINGELYDEHRIDATPRLGTAERWIVENGGGGWWHPFHSHLEGHQVQRINGRVPPPWGRYKRDITNLESGAVIEVFQKFRTFTGPFVWHCHTAEHEDMRMMNNFEVQR
jgi:FtsP/CotA-like multicopper oxidase with cupredoxin domain